MKTPKPLGDYLQEMQSLSDREIREWAAKQMRGGERQGRSADYLRIKAARAIMQEREANARNGKPFSWGVF